ncbi:RNA methyltransferase bin3 [Gracilaria domingensis]|nr:RNA methyltransferase bin3 [Gracilaria domingensis]
MRKHALADAGAGEASSGKVDMCTLAKPNAVSSRPKKQLPSRKRPRPSSSTPSASPLAKKPRDQSKPGTAVVQANTSGTPTKHGSYRNYYNRRLRGNDPSTDDRLPLIKNLCDAYERFSVLDVGCNDGKLTMEVAKQSRCVRAVGVDIDGKLIRYAHASLRRHAQRQMKESKTDGKRSSSRTVGFPFNTAFRKEDLSAEQPSQSQSQSVSDQYNVVLCLSVTKWVHISGGDQALQRLFHRMYQTLKPDGVLILEPQPVKSYKLARQKGLAPKESSFDNLKMKPSMFSEFLLEQCGFSAVRMLRDKRPSGKAFNRPIYAFFKGNEAPSLKRFDEAQSAQPDASDRKQEQPEATDEAESKPSIKESQPSADAVETVANGVDGKRKKRKSKKHLEKNTEP